MSPELINAISNLVDVWTKEKNLHVTGATQSPDQTETKTKRTRSRSSKPDVDSTVPEVDAPVVPEVDDVVSPAVKEALAGITQEDMSEIKGQPAAGRRRRRTTQTDSPQKGTVGQDVKTVANKTFTDASQVDWTASYARCKFRDLDLSDVNLSGVFTECEFVGCTTAGESSVSFTGVLTRCKFDNVSILVSGVSGEWNGVELVNAGLEGLDGEGSINVDATFLHKDVTVDPESILDFPNDKLEGVQFT